ncbi:MAG: hypothetical protein N3A68_06045 [Bacteroidia bacterium]|jgi:hypothetical protein|nr:hypothetical protein [Bacteroidia bacterium]
MRWWSVLVGAGLWAQTQAVAPAIQDKAISGTEVPPELGAVRRRTATGMGERDTTIAVAPELGKRARQTTSTQRETLGPAESPYARRGRVRRAASQIKPEE